MKILFVDDESKKLKRLHRIVERIEGIDSNDIEDALALIDAKSKLKNMFYDLVVIDLKITDSIGEESENDSEIAGLEFITEILGTDSIKTPQEIIILTEHDELHKKCIELGWNLKFQILKYDEQSQEWENIIKNKVKYRLNYEKSVSLFSDNLPCDVAIVCAVNVEMDAIKNAFKDETLTLINFKNDSSNYYYTELNKADRKTRIIISQQREMGIAAATNLTQSIMYHFKPRYIIMVGIAAGIGAEKNLGDIIIATEVWNYSNGKYITGTNDELEFSPDPKHIPLKPVVESLFKRDYTSNLFSIRKAWQYTVENDLNLVLGPLACGAAVVGNSTIVDDMIKKHSRKTVGLDMESYGVFYAANYGLNDCTTPICIKSISDFADKEKEDSYQKYAAYTSATFTKHIIEDVLPF